mgnify:CR=1 FL=1
MRKASRSESASACSMRRRNKGGALVSARLCRLPEQEVHQPSSMAIICLVGVLIAWLVHLKGVHLSQVHQPSSMAFICLVGALLARLVHFLLGWSTYCLVGAPPEVTSAQIHRLRPPSDRIASAVRSDSVRRPIGFRSPSDDLSIKIVAEVSGLRSTKSDTNKYS